MKRPSKQNFAKCLYFKWIIDKWIQFLYRNEVLKKMNEKNAQNRNRLNHQINYNDNNGLIGITTSSTISHHVNVQFSFYTWLGQFTQQKIQMRTLSIHFPIAIITYFLSLCIISLRNWYQMNNRCYFKRLEDENVGTKINYILFHSIFYHGT